MELYSENESYKLYQGNMLDMLDNIKENSIDSIVTDPPYELNFMGKGWDNAGISFNKATWSKCYEALKPGGYLLAFGGSRTYHRIACAIEDAGFEIRDTIMWLYGSGFPKSMDISKQIDKRNGRNYNEDFRNYINSKRLEKNISLKQINEKLGVSTTGGGMASNIFGRKQETKNVLPTKKQYKILKDLLELDDRFDNLIFLEEAEREVIGKKEYTSPTKIIDIGNYNGDRKQLYNTAPATDLAKQWQGWGTALKPSFEPIIVARKPFKGSLVDNVIKYGVGGINIDECRVENSNNEKLTRNLYNNPSWKNSSKAGQGSIDDTSDRLGRFPANTILTYDETDFEEVCGEFPKDNKGNSNARYFYCAKASKRDRDEGLDCFLTQKMKVTNQYELPRDDGSVREIPCRKNIHPTVKPTTLMQYLVRLVTPNGGIVLDPFNGSGSTGKAVMYENKDRKKNYKYIGIELNEEYLPIAKARIEYVDNEIKGYEI